MQFEFGDGTFSEPLFFDEGDTEKRIRVPLGKEGKNGKYAYLVVSELTSANEALDMSGGLEPSIDAIKEMDDMIVSSIVATDKYKQAQRDRNFKMSRIAEKMALAPKPNFSAVRKGDRINLGGETYATALEDGNKGNHHVLITTPVDESGIFYKLSNWFKSLNLTD